MRLTRPADLTIEKEMDIAIKATITILAILAALIVGVVASCFTHKPKDYRVEYGVSYWTDEEGHRMMEDRNGNVRQLTNPAETQGEGGE